ncbi:MAG: sigma-54-dependent Fis family transcriptional regulator [Alphaproteobacteria bacterium]|nr:sigma-54-dependent Fis family transcriptional regulator [Alphaproteobacteria bacterium]
MRLIVFGEKFEDHLFEIVAISNILNGSMLFFKNQISTNIEHDDIIIVTNTSVKRLPQSLKNTIVTVTFAPKYQKNFENEVVISVSEISSIPNLLGIKKSLPIICDEKSEEVFSLALKVATSNATILISGETGTGKEILAKFIHDHSGRKNKKFVSINCAAIPETLLESELFGYERGAFSGAFQQRIGKFQEANRGTILLDEIGEMPLAIQAKLLRAIQEQEISRLGSNESIKIDTRIIATTNRDLAHEVSIGHFREDLYYRLNVISIVSPRLNDRLKDIRPLAQYFCEKYSGGKNVLSEKFLQNLENIYWKGNIRELENFVHRAVVLADSRIIEPESFTCQPNAKSLKEIEKESILKSLRNNNGNKSKTSEELDISVRTLRYKLAEYRKSSLNI